MAEHIVKPKTYLLVYAALLCLTALTVGASLIPMEWPALHLAVALAIGGVKAGLVILFFMHVLYSSKLIWLVALGGLLWLAILIVYTMNDYVHRDSYSTLIKIFMPS
jgi:cytochrome c oxidase subunit 4